MIRQFTAAALFLSLLGVMTLWAATEGGVEVAGRQAADALKKNLMGALMKALSDGGVSAAIEVCSAQAMDLTKKSGEMDPAVISIERRTDRWRNPGNKADTTDREVMEAFRKDKELKELTRKESEEVTRYYQPLRTMSLCLQCHGDAEKYSQEVRQVLEKHYPQDRATGYTEGELRGVIQVRIKNTDENETNRK